MSDPTAKRTTVILRPEDKLKLESSAVIMGTTDTEVIRRSLRLLNEMLLWRENGGEIVFERDGQQERVRFL